MSSAAVDELAHACVSSQVVVEDEACPLPEDRLLAEFACALRDAGHWGVIVDADWRVAYTTDEFRLAQGFMVQLAPIALGKHLFSEERISLSERSIGDPQLINIYRDTLTNVGEWVLADTPGGRDALRELVDPRLRDVVDGLVATENLVASSSIHGGRGLEQSRPTMDFTVIRIRDVDGRLAGTAMIEKPHIGMSTMATISAMSDPEHLARMQSVASAGRRPAAILFADLEGSSLLAKQLPTERYFALVRRMTRAADKCVVDAGGITGRHVGDGVVAFFVAETLGSESAAAASAISAARSLASAVADVAVRSGLNGDDVVMRFGLHWGATIYIGLITTAGRTEVTALGDEVNDCARIEASATGGRTLASKALIEHLLPDAAKTLGIDVSQITYRQLGEMPTVTHKAQRDAPSVAVCEL